MASEAPPFWWREPDWRSAALAPLAWVYGEIARRRLASAPRRPVPLPVLCVGNLTVGGSGKTPVAIALAEAARAAGHRPGILSRGHGGSAVEPHLVDAAHDSARIVGDEPLLLAEHAPVAVAVDRAAGAELLARGGCDFLIMDDGFQSARIRIDFALIVVDALFGIGNGRIIPAGPLRAPLADQIRYADAILAMGKGEAASDVVRMGSRAGKPVLAAFLRPRDSDWLAGRRVLAFAGIGHPEKFFASLREIGAVPAFTRAFPDHHPYTQEEVADLLATAAAGGLDIVTTAKDAVRLRDDPVAAPLRDKLVVVDVEAAFDDAQAPARIIAETVANWRRRRDAVRR